MLHITNGESTTRALRKSTIQGEVFSFRDALISGPTPAAIDASEWRAIRAQHLSDAYGGEFESCQKDLLEQDQILQDIESHQEVVLWFEYDLFCQINLLYLLHQMSQRPAGRVRLSLVNIGSFPGKPSFRGLGELSPDELASLFPLRESLTSEHLQLAASAWDAYCSPDPTRIEMLLQTDLSRLPFLDEALSAHLRRFPSLQNGLGQVESSALRLVNQGLHRFSELFPQFANIERVYGLGDAQLLNSLRRLIQVQEPLVSLKETGIETLDSKSIEKFDLEITDTGKAVLQEQADFIVLNGINDWLGGVQLIGSQQIWRWDTEAGRLALI